MSVALQYGIRPNFKFCSVRTYSGEGQCDSDIQICRKSFCRLARRSFKYPEWLGDVFNVYVVFDEIRSANEPPDRLPGNHPDRMDVPDRRRRHGVESNERTRKGCQRAGFHPQQLHHRTRFGFGLITLDRFSPMHATDPRRTEKV